MHRLVLAAGADAEKALKALMVRKTAKGRDTYTRTKTNMAMENHHFIRRYIFKRSIFHCYVSLAILDLKTTINIIKHVL